MPNWCKGVLKVRGKKKDLLNFINNGIERLGWPRIEEEYTNYPLNIEEDEYGDLFIPETDQEHHSWLYFKDSRRLFIDENVQWYWNDDTEEELEEVYVQCLDIKQAWNLEPEYFKKISKEFELDFKIIGLECGCQFSQEIEVINGEITKYEENEYEDYNWEVYDPRIGG